MIESLFHVWHGVVLLTLPQIHNRHYRHPTCFASTWLFQFYFCRGQKRQMPPTIPIKRKWHGRMYPSGTLRLFQWERDYVCGVLGSVWSVYYSYVAISVIVTKSALNLNYNSDAPAPIFSRKKKHERKEYIPKESNHTYRSKCNCCWWNSWNWRETNSGTSLCLCSPGTYIY